MRTAPARLLVTIALILPLRMSAQQQAPALPGYGARASAAERRLEAEAIARPDPTRARAHSRALSAESHVAGTPRVRAFFCVQTDPIFAAGSGTLPSQLLELAGGTNVVTLERYPRLDIEAVAAAKPEVILQARMDLAKGEAHVEDAFWKRWPSIPAVSAGRVVVLPDDLTLRPGPRVADAVEELAGILHGEPGGGAR